MISLESIAVVHADHHNRRPRAGDHTLKWVDMVELGSVYHKPKLEWQSYSYRDSISDIVAKCGATGTFVNLDLALVQQTDIKPCGRCFRKEN